MDVTVGIWAATSSASSLSSPSTSSPSAGTRTRWVFARRRSGRSSTSASPSRSGSASGSSPGARTAPSTSRRTSSRSRSRSTTSSSSSSSSASSAVPAVYHQRSLCWSRGGPGTGLPGRVHRDRCSGARDLRVHVRDLRGDPDLDGHRPAAPPRRRPQPVGQPRRAPGEQGRAVDGGVRRPPAVHPHHGCWVATPLFLVMVAIGSTDLLFALDSIPATFGVTQEAFLVFTANAFALLWDCAPSTSCSRGCWTSSSTSPSACRSSSSSSA